MIKQMSRLKDSVMVPTSPLLVIFELENGRIESWTLHESFRSMS
jgi:hypothetical protein